MKRDASGVLAVIPARLGSERLPRKPLQALNGRPLIQWVWERVVTFASIDAAVVATDSEEIADVCRSFGANVVITSVEHRSGTERAAEVIGMQAYSVYDVVVNIQGDEPFVSEDHVDMAVKQVRAGHDIGTVAAPVLTRDAWNDASVVKVVRGVNSRALYFSRAPIPHLRDGDPDEAALRSDNYLRHIGVYAYTRDALMRWVALPETPLERIEKLEQLRPLAAGMSIGVGVVAEAVGGIDTKEDLVRAETLLRASNV
jgi:3-deoxy-manno-octulosonate cytidylyltransferase (CMP-KDO synthetase)